MRVFGADGRQLLTFNTGAGAVQASPVLVDVNHDGILDVVAANLAGDVVAFDGRGRTLFHQRVMGGCSAPRPLPTCRGTAASMWWRRPGISTSMPGI